MLIAVACDGLDIAPTLAQCTSYMCYAVEHGVPVSCRNMPAMDQTVDKLPSFFKAIGASVLISGAIDSGMRAIFDGADLEVVSDASGEPLEAVRAYLQE